MYDVQIENSSVNKSIINSTLKDMKQRIKYYSGNDMAIPYNLQMIVSWVEKFDVNRNDYSINDIIEMYCIIKYNKSGMKLDDWMESFCKEYDNCCKNLKRVIGVYLANGSQSDLIGWIKNVDVLYRDDLWEIISQYKVYERISAGEMTAILDNYPWVLSHILQYPALVEKYDEQLKTALLARGENAEILMKAALVKSDNVIILPKSLLPGDCTELVFRYIQLKDCNPNYLELLMHSAENQRIGLTARIKLDASDRYKERIKEIINPESGFKYGVEVKFDNLDWQHRSDAVVCTHGEDGILRITYDINWVEDNLDYPTLLNNFIYLFAFVDSQMRCSFTSVNSRVSAIESMIGINGKAYFRKGIQFEYLNMLSLVNMQAYFQVLRNYNISIEVIFKWFFESYLKDEFNAQGFIFNAPTEGSSWLEKCKVIATEMDSILKQFTLFVEEGEIDRRLFEISSKPVDFGEVPSFLSTKYAYIEGTSAVNDMLRIFSDQSMLNYNVKEDRSYTSFYDRIDQEKLRYDSLEHFQKAEIDALASKGYVLINPSSGMIEYDPHRAHILREMYNNDVICTSYLRQDGDAIQSMADEGALVYESRLFSRPEYHLMDYYLNKSKYSDGFDLRNRYIHGTYPDDEKQNATDYFTFLRLMTIIVIKINEEFVLKDRQQ